MSVPESVAVSAVSSAVKVSLPLPPSSVRSDAIAFSVPFWSLKTGLSSVGSACQEPARLPTANVSLPEPLQGPLEEQAPAGKWIGQ